MKVLLMHTLPPAQSSAGRRAWEFDLAEPAGEIAAEIPGCVLKAVRGEPGEMMSLIAAEAPDVVFNLCEAPLCNPRLEAHAAALFEWLGVAFTGSSSATLELCRRKDLTKIMLAAAGVPVPVANVLPCIVKPLDEDGSAGIHDESVCETREQIDAAVARLSVPALVEEFLPGREFGVSLWGRREAEHVVINEIRYDGGVRLLTYDSKWEVESHAYVNTPVVFPEGLPDDLRAQLTGIATTAWRVMGLRGYGTIDIRLDAAGTPRVLDVNANPTLIGDGRVYQAVIHAGWTWRRFIQQQLEWCR
jgi:D-alanine-D-alanine ligase